MHTRLRQERNVFLTLLAAVFVLLMTALPLVTASVAMTHFLDMQVVRR